MKTVTTATKAPQSPLYVVCKLILRPTDELRIEVLMVFFLFTPFCLAQSDRHHCAGWPSASSRWSCPTCSGCFSPPVATSPSALCPGSEQRRSRKHIIGVSDSSRTCEGWARWRCGCRGGTQTLARVSGDTSSSGTQSLVVFFPGICRQCRKRWIF